MIIPPMSPQAYLAGRFPPLLPMFGLEYRRLQITHSGIFTCIHVDGRKRLGLVEHERAAAFQPHLAGKALLDLTFDPVFIKYIFVVPERPDAGEKLGRQIGYHFPHPRGRTLAADREGLDIVAE